MKKVVTYQLAYLSNKQVTLCDKCAKIYATPLGPTRHGKRKGRCENCETQK